ncbi:ATP-binding protein [Reichenbachiella sp. MALMAid0571]|uniref:ATP-binding protein n=1 Tax=Reichenbachiella sp. MALMAid0571 TaxID=3143939 RepID=UPI0032DE3B6C
MNYLIRTKKGKVLSTDLPNELIDDAVNCDKEFEAVLCTVQGIKKRQGIIDSDNLILYLCCFDPNKTNKIFKHQIQASKGFLKAYQDSYRTMSEEERKKTRRLKHNLSTYTTKIHQELFKLLPQEKVSGGRSNQREVVKSILEKNPDHAVTTLLRILKNANLIKSEFDVYDIMHTPNPYIDLQKHSIHKVITLSLSSFWLDFIDKGISVNMDKCVGMMNFDYKSMSSILCHIFDNATKYVAADSEFIITVIDDSDYQDIIFDMISLRVQKDELNKIFEDGFSSDYSERLGYAGAGVGMNVIKKLSELNGFRLKFENNIDPSKSIMKMKIPFDHNKLTIGIPK